MANLSGFDASLVPPTSSPSPLPVGNYVAVIKTSQNRPTRDGTNQYLEITFEIAEGPHKGRRLWANLNLRHTNPQAVQYAQAELAAICRAVGVTAPRDSVVLHGRSLVITVGLRTRPDTNALVNVIRSYAPHQTQQPSTEIPW